MAAIELDFALTGTHVTPTFTATGTFTGNLADITCDVIRPGSSPVTLASGVVTANGSGGWRAAFTAGLSPESGLALVARIAGSPADEDEQTDITVDGAPPLQLSPLPNPRPTPIPVSGLVTINIDGTHRPDVIGIFCVAFVFYRKNIESVAATSVGAIDTPAAGQWQASLTYTALTAQRKLGVLAVGINQKGKIRGRAFRRRR